MHEQGGTARRSTASRNFTVAHRSATVMLALKNRSPCTGGSGAALAGWIPYCPPLAGLYPFTKDPVAPLHGRSFPYRARCRGSRGCARAQRRGEGGAPRPSGRQGCGTA